MVCILGVRVLNLIEQEANLVLLDAELLTPPSDLCTQRTGRPCLPQGLCDCVFRSYFESI